MAKQSWLNKQLDHASTVVRSWSEWKRQTLRSQIANVGGTGSSQISAAERSSETDAERGTRRIGSDQRSS
jgi:hypothetical protein